jgi:hypothetical protein
MKTWGHQDLVAANNADWNEELILGLPSLDIADPTSITMQIRRGADAVDADLTLTLANGLLEIADAAARKVNVSVPAATMATLSSGTCVYDVVVVKDGDATRALEGSVAITRSITR